MITNIEVLSPAIVHEDSYVTFYSRLQIILFQSFQSNPKYIPEAVLLAHNYYRAHHGSPPLELDKDNFFTFAFISNKPKYSHTVASISIRTSKRQTFNFIFFMDAIDLGHIIQRIIYGKFNGLSHGTTFVHVTS